MLEIIHFALSWIPIIDNFQSLNCVSSTLTTQYQTTKIVDELYVRSIVQFRKPLHTTPNYIMIDIHIKGSSDHNDLPSYMVVYGVKGYQNDVSSSIYDQTFSIENSKMKMKLDLDMSNGNILNFNYKTKYFLIGE